MNGYDIIQKYFEAVDLLLTGTALKIFCYQSVFRKKKIIQ